MNITVRPIKSREIMLMADFLYEAVFQRDTDPLAPRTIIQQPSLWTYVDKFGTEKDDHCLVAEVGGYLVGAAWARCMNAYGHIGAAVPELAVSVYPQYRGNGIGTRLVRQMIGLLSEKGYAKVSLSVQKDNYARRLYQKAGFEIVDENEQEYIMACRLS